jgi:ubiquinone/menaquinone biosynthesis C-methylase UbiE
LKRSVVSTLRCPACRRELRLAGSDARAQEINDGQLVCDCGKIYPVDGGTPNLIYPDRLLPSDEESQKKYDKGAEEYDAGLDWLFSSFSKSQEEVRSQMVELLELRPDARVLEVGCGTGKDSAVIASQLGSDGALYAQDLSLGMIRLARRRLGGVATSVEYFLSNAAYLPFVEGYFDAVFHFGGLNTFGEIGRALAEMTRVTRVGGKVVVGDEGVAPWLRKKRFGRILINANPLYRHRPPLMGLPESAQEVKLRWILGNAFYVIDFRVGSGPPPVDLDLPIPGKADSLRSRYERSAKQRREL